MKFKPATDLVTRWKRSHLITLECEDQGYEPQSLLWRPQLIYRYHCAECAVTQPRKSTSRWTAHRRSAETQADAHEKAHIRQDELNSRLTSNPG